jgi:glutaminyl-tRNA synthetase
MYDRLFNAENPLAEDDFISTINADSLQVLDGCMLEPAAGDIEVGVPVQFERKGYFCKDPDSMGGMPVWNRTVALRDTWKKILRNED